MKRTRTRADGEKRSRQRRRCPKCNRQMTMNHWGKGSGGRTWACKKCFMWFRWDAGVLVARAVKRENESRWYGEMGDLEKYPEGMLVTYGGVEV